MRKSAAKALGELSDPEWQNLVRGNEQDYARLWDRTAHKLGVEFLFESSRPSGDGLCSDSECPYSETPIPRGEGYLWISQECVEMRKDAKSIEELEKKVQRIRA